MTKDAYDYRLFLAFAYFETGDYANSVKGYDYLKQNFTPVKKEFGEINHTIDEPYMKEKLQKACALFLNSGQQDEEAQRLCDRRYLMRAYYWLSGLFR